MTRSLIYVSRGDLDLTSTSQGGSLVEKFEHLAGETVGESSSLRAEPGRADTMFNLPAVREVCPQRKYPFEDRPEIRGTLYSLTRNVVETSLVAQTEFQEWKLLASCELRRLRTDKEARTSVRESTRI